MFQFSASFKSENLLSLFLSDGTYLRSGRWDSNPRHSPWQGDALPLSYARVNCGFVHHFPTGFALHKIYNRKSGEVCQLFF